MDTPFVAPTMCSPSSSAKEQMSLKTKQLENMSDWSSVAVWEDSYQNTVN